MANRYWVGGTATWNNTAGTKWATTSGGAGGSAVPTASDDVFFDLLSSVLGTDVITTSGTTLCNCRSINFTGFIGTFSHAASTTVRIGTSTSGNFTTVAGMTYTIGSASTSILSFISSTTGNTVTSGGITLPQMTFSTSGGEWTLVDNLTINSGSTLTLGTGTLKTDGASDNSGLTHSWGAFNSNSGTRTLTLGNSSITITGTIVPAWRTDGANFTLNEGTSSITVTGAGSVFNNGASSNSKNYYNVAFTGSGTSQLQATSAVSYHNLSATGTAVKTDIFQPNFSFTVTNQLNLAGNSTINRLFVRPLTIGTTITVTNTGASHTWTNVDVRDIALTTTYNASATNVGDCQGNSGITFPTAVTQTWQGTSGGNWSDVSKWTSRVPLPHDDVLISSAFTSGQVITTDMPRLGKSLDFSGLSWTGTAFNLTIGTANEIYGSLIFKAGMTVTTGSTPALLGRSSFSLNTQSVPLAALTINAFGGTYTLASAYLGTASISLTNGTFIDAGFSVSITGLSSSNSNTRAIIKSGNWTLSSTSAPWNTATSTNLTVTDTGNMTITDTSASTKTFAGGSKTYYNLTVTTGGSGLIIISGSNSFNRLIATGGSTATVQITAGTTQTLTGGTDSFFRGVSGNLITIQSTTGASAWNVVKTSGYVDSDYISLQDSAASGGALFLAGTHSTNVSGNSGWNFTDGRVSPDLLTLVSSLQTATYKSDFSFAASILTLAASVEVPSFLISSLITPAILTITSSIETPSEIISLIFAAANLDLLSSVQSPTLKIDVTLIPTILTLTSNIQDPIIKIDVIISVNNQTITATVQAPNIATLATFVADILSLTSSVETVVVPTSIIITPDVQTLTAELLDIAFSGERKGIKISFKVNKEIFRNLDVKHSITRSFRRG